ncbi:AAA family ATPase [Actinomycetaceae bacterium L2_0104]
MKIVELQAENVKRLKAVEIRPDGTLQVIGGRNAQGKSSVLDAIWLALGGGKAAKETTLPIREGESKASVRLDLGDLVITRSWTRKGTSLKVTNAEGASYSSPQSMLDALVGRLSFDPLEFTRLSAKDQREALLGLVDLGIDIDELARQRAVFFAERSEVGRRGKAIGDVHVDDDLPVEETSAQDIIRQIREAEAQNRRADDAMSDYEATTREVEQMEAHVDALRQQLSDAEGSLYAASQRAEMKLKAMQKFVKVDVSPLEDELEGVEELNQKIRANNGARKQAKHKDDMRRDYELLTEKIRKLDEHKEKALASATFPVEGLGFDDAGVTYNGVPFSQASSAEQIRVSVAMAMAMNPRLRVLRIKDGSLLDDDAMTALREQVAENDFQLWIERVGDADEGAIIISDGEVAA